MTGDIIIATLGYGLTGWFVVLGLASFRSALKEAFKPDHLCDDGRIGRYATAGALWLSIAFGFAVMTRGLFLLGACT